MVVTFERLVFSVVTRFPFFPCIRVIVLFFNLTVLPDTVMDCFGATTFTVILDFFPLYVAVITAVPAFLPDMTPFLLTVATAFLFVVHFGVTFFPLYLAVTVYLSPAYMLTFVLLTLSADAANVGIEKATIVAMMSNSVNIRFECLFMVCSILSALQ